MKQMTIEQIVDSALEKARLAWLVLNFIASVLIFTYLGGLWLFTVPIIWVTSYQLMLVSVGAYLAITVPRELVEHENNKEKVSAFQEINERIEEGDLTPGKELDSLIEKAGLNISVILSTSDAKVGSYMGKDIFEWIEVNDPTTDNSQIFSYERIAEQDGSGNFIVPAIEGKICTLFNCCIYSRALA